MSRGRDSNPRRHKGRLVYSQVQLSTLPPLEIIYYILS
jgi:hypothetical protein